FKESRTSRRFWAWCHIAGILYGHLDISSFPSGSPSLFDVAAGHLLFILCLWNWCHWLSASRPGCREIRPAQCPASWGLYLIRRHFHDTQPLSLDDCCRPLCNLLGILHFPFPDSRLCRPAGCPP